MSAGVMRRKAGAFFCFPEQGHPSPARTDATDASAKPPLRPSRCLRRARGGSRVSRVSVCPPGAESLTTSDKPIDNG